MDEITLLCEIALALDGFIAVFVSLEYYFAKKTYNAFKNAYERGVNSVKNTDLNTTEPTYAVVCGRAKAIGPPIKSLSKPNIQGVFHAITIQEHGAKRFQGVWTDVKKIIDAKYNAIPFLIKDGKYSVTVTSPLRAKFMYLPLVEDHFEKSDSSILSLVFGVHEKGFQYSESMLKEDDFVTGFGELILGEKQNLQLIPPRNGVSYILSYSDPETILAKLNCDIHSYGFLASLFGLIGLSLLSYILYRWWKMYEERRRNEKLAEEVERARIERQRNAPRDPVNEENFLCVICHTQQREVVVLPCGHICMCFDCSCQCLNTTHRLCPMCRRTVDSSHLIYLS